MKREFSSLSPREALYLAAFVEQRNARLYREFGELFDAFGDPESCEIGNTFWDMAEEEEHHASVLQERYRERYGDEACEISEDDVRDHVEVPKISGGEIFALARAQVSPVPRNRAFQIALAAEQSALKFYARLLQTTKEPELRRVYEELANDEDEHIRSLRKRIADGIRSAASSYQA
jgi:erythrin-vacuolar iron transport family protein